MLRVSRRDIKLTQGQFACAGLPLAVPPLRRPHRASGHCSALVWTLVLKAMGIFGMSPVHMRSVELLGCGHRGARERAHVLLPPLPTRVGLWGGRRLAQLPNSCMQPTHTLHP